jgi:hypothetical protein
MSAAVLTSLPGIWGAAVAALALILSAVSVVWVSINRARVSIARIKADHIAAMFELETARQKMLHDAELQREKQFCDVRQPEIPFLSQRRIEKSQIAKPEAEAA